MSDTALSESQIGSFSKDGFVLVAAMFDAEEMRLLIDAATADQSLCQQALDRDDGEGGISRLAGWNHPGDDLSVSRARQARRMLTS